jgi:hypothetical protein
MPSASEIEAGQKVFRRVELLNGSLASDMLFDVEVEALTVAILCAAELEREDEMLRAKRAQVRAGRDR